MEGGRAAGRPTNKCPGGPFGRFQATAAFLAPRAPPPASSNGFTQLNLESVKSDSMAFNESGRDARGPSHSLDRRVTRPAPRLRLHSVSDVLILKFDPKSKFTIRRN